MILSSGSILLISDTLPRSFARFKAFAMYFSLRKLFFFPQPKRWICIHFLRWIVCQSVSESVSIACFHSSITCYCFISFSACWNGYVAFYCLPFWFVSFSVSRLFWLCPFFSTCFPSTASSFLLLFLCVICLSPFFLYLAIVPVLPMHSIIVH